MMELMSRSHSNVVGVHVSGTLHDADYRTLLPRLEDLFKEHGALRMLFYADEGFEGWDLKAAWDDATFGFGHIAQFERMALVGAPDWVNWCVKLSGFLFKGEVRIFPADQLDSAWEWLEG